MEKEIEFEKFKDIVTTYTFLDTQKPMDLNLAIRRSILKTAENYKKDGRISFDYENMEKLQQSDYYTDYDGSLYKNKKPPFVSALMENLVKSDILALYHVQALCEKIMQDVIPLAKVVTSQPMEFNFSFKSPDLIISSNDMMLPDFNPLLRKMLNELGTSINDVEGQIALTKHAFENYGFSYLELESQSVSIFQKGNEFIFGEQNSRDTEHFYELQEKYKDIPFVDGGSLIIIEKNQLIKLLAKDLGEELAQQEVNKFLAESPWSQFKVEPGEYSFKQTNDLNSFKDEIPSEDITPLFSLKSSVLDNKLDKKTKLKM